MHTQHGNHTLTDFPVTLYIPPHLYERARRLAEANDVPIEQVILNWLESALVELPSLPPDEQAELDALSHLSDDALWTIAREQMPADRQRHMQVLMDRNNLGTITAPERDELAALVEQGQRLMLRKAQAMALLARRGHPIHPDDLARE